MTSLLPTPGATLANRTSGVRSRDSVSSGDLKKYGAEQGLADEDAIAKGMEEESKKFIDNGAEVGTPTCA